MGDKKTINFMPAFKLFASAVVTAMLWCGVFPLLSQIGPIKEHIDAMEANGIDVGAMFYTELDALDSTIRRLENR